MARAEHMHRRHAFSLVELLVVVAIVAALLGILVPTLASMRTVGRDVRCLANLRSTAASWRLYASEHDDLTPALGVPWSESPNWAIVVSEYTGGAVRTASTLPGGEASVLVCPSTQRNHANVALTRTYAANVTGFAGAPGDRGDFDLEPTFARFSRVRSPSVTPMILDSALIPPGPDLPPPTRTASVVDFRDPSHVEERIGRVHGEGPAGTYFHVAHYDGAAQRADEVADAWRMRIND